MDNTQSVISPVETRRIEIPITSSMPMRDMVQSAFLGHVIDNEKIFIQVTHRVQPGWFSNTWHSKVYRALMEHAVRIGRAPSKVEFLNSRELQLQDLGDKNKMITTIETACIHASQIRWDAIKPDLTDWLKSKILQETILKSANHWNNGRWHETASLMQNAVTEFRDAAFEEGMEISFADPEIWLAKHKEEKKEALPTGLPLLDAALLDGATSGGLQRGDTTVVLAPSNAGKTTCLLSIARHNVVANNNVLLMTHEGRPEDIRNKIMKSMLDCTEEEMLSMYHTKEGLAQLRTASNALAARLTYIPYNKAGMKVEDVVPIIRRAVEERRAKTGKGYDLLVCDYPAKLTTEQAKGSLALRSIIDIVYDFYVQLALEYNFHSLLAIQTNREGSKVNQGQNTNRLLTMEDVQEAWGPMTSASNVITLNRSPIAKMKNRMTFYVCKSRSSETGRAIVAETKFGHGLTHSTKLRSTGYLGTSTMEATIDTFLSSHNGQMMPQNLVR